MSFAICFNLDQSKILSYGYGLNDQRKYCTHLYLRKFVTEAGQAWFVTRAVQRRCDRDQRYKDNWKNPHSSTLPSSSSTQVQWPDTRYAGLNTTNCPSVYSCVHLKVDIGMETLWWEMLQSADIRLFAKHVRVTELRRSTVTWLVVLGFHATFTAKVIS